MNYEGLDRRRIGRPPVGERVNVRLPDDLHDLACRIALHEDISLSAVIRRWCEAHVRTHSVAVNSPASPTSPTL